LSTKLTPPGRAPVSVRLGAGKPVVATEKLPAAPTVNVVEAPLVIAGAWPTVSVKLCVAAVPMPLLAVIVIGKAPEVAEVPLSVAVPLPLSMKVTPAGSAPVSVNAAVGKAVEVTVKLPGVFTVKATLLALVMLGCWSMVMVKPFVAVRPSASVTLAVIIEVPEAVGVPVIAPVEAFSSRPFGSVPVLMLQVSGVTPPAAASVAE